MLKTTELAMPRTRKVTTVFHRIAQTFSSSSNALIYEITTLRSLSSAVLVTALSKREESTGMRSISARLGFVHLGYHFSTQMFIGNNEIRKLAMISMTLNTEKHLMDRIIRFSPDIRRNRLHLPCGLIIEAQMGHTDGFVPVIM